MKLILADKTELNVSSAVLRYDRYDAELGNLEDYLDITIDDCNQDIISLKELLTQENINTLKIVNDNGVEKSITGYEQFRSLYQDYARFQTTIRLFRI